MIIIHMTRNQGVSKIKLFGAIASLAILVTLLFATASNTSTSPDKGYINPAFVGDGGKDVTINMDTLTTTFDETADGVVVHYIVQEGDTLETIAAEFGITVSNLKKINGIKSVKPWDKIIVTNEEDGIIYTVRETQNIKVFANKYNLNLEDLMTLNYILDDTEMLQKGQEVFINVSAESANAIPGFIDKGQPNLAPQVVTPRVTATNTSTTKTTTSTTSSNTANSVASVTTSRRTFTSNITNGFARGYCTWYAATQMESIFVYTNEERTQQSRPFGGDAKYWYENARKAGFSVGQSPRAGSIIVYGQLRSSAGHVGIVRSVDTANGTMVIEDMNYDGKFVVTRRTEQISRKEIIGYIYG